MSVHFDFMTSFQSLLSEAPLDPLKRQVLVCQALIKCADISNPVGYLDPDPSPFGADPFSGSSPWCFKTMGKRVDGRMDEASTARTTSTFASIRHTFQQRPNGRGKLTGVLHQHIHLPFICPGSIRHPS